MNKWLKHDLHQLKPFCAEKRFETFRAKSVETCLTATLYHLSAYKIFQDQDFDKWWISYNYEQLAP